jgi:LPXTG-motif cell wall-anchored protein
VAKTADDTAEWPAALGAFGGLLALSGCALLVRRRRDADDADTAA